MQLEEFQPTGTTARKNKISYNSRGAMLAIGMEEILPYKQMHPVYAELVYQRMDAYKVSIVDASNFRQVEITSREGTNQHVIGNVIMIAMGISIL